MILILNRKSKLGGGGLLWKCSYYSEKKIQVRITAPFPGTSVGASIIFYLLGVYFPLLTYVKISSQSGQSVNTNQVDVFVLSRLVTYFQMLINPIMSLLIVVIVQVNRQLSKRQVLKENDFAKHGITMIKSISHAGHSVINHNACERTQHATTSAFTLTAVCLLFRK